MKQAPTLVIKNSFIVPCKELWSIWKRLMKILKSHLKVNALDHRCLCFFRIWRCCLFIWNIKLCSYFFAEWEFVYPSLKWDVLFSSSEQEFWQHQCGVSVFSVNDENVLSNWCGLMVIKLKTNRTKNQRWWCCLEKFYWQLELSTAAFCVRVMVKLSLASVGH